MRKRKKRKDVKAGKSKHEEVGRIAHDLPKYYLKT